MLGARQSLGQAPPSPKSEDAIILSFERHFLWHLKFERRDAETAREKLIRTNVAVHKAVCQCVGTGDKLGNGSRYIVET